MKPISYIASRENWFGMRQRVGSQRRIWSDYQALCMFIILALLTTGCTNFRPPPTNPAESAHPNPSALIVVPAKYKPAAKLDRILLTKGEAAARGAGKGVAVGAYGGAKVSMAFGPLFILVLPIAIPVGAVAGAAIGSAYEASMAAPEETVKKGRQTLEKVIAHLQLQQRLQQGITAALQREEIAKTITVNSDIGPASTEDHPDYRQLNGPMVLEVAVQGFGFSRLGITSSDKDGFILDMTAHARLVDTAHHTVVDELHHMYQSQARTATEWLQDNGQGFTKALDEGIRNTASDIVLEFFLLYYPPHRNFKPSERNKMTENVKPFPDSVLQPIGPKPVFRRHFLAAFFGESAENPEDMQFSPVDSLQPTFRWQAFPRPADIKGTHSNPDEFSDVSYDIAIFRDIRRYTPGAFWDSYYYAAGPLIFARSGLKDPQFHLETPLEPCGRYAWSVRAHFLLDGRPRVTEWTGIYDGGLPWLYRRYGETLTSTSYIPIEHPKDYYPLFRTPPAAGVKKCAE